jgi:dolichyl-phosphate beta-glucosyltransferase
MSRAFNTFVRMTLLPGVLDTQAGLKGFTAAAAHEVFSRATVAGFGFDVECLFIAQQHGLSVTPVPVAFRYDDEPSTVHFVRDSARMARDVARVRLNGWRGVYMRVPLARSEALDAQRGTERTESATSRAMVH